MNETDETAPEWWLPPRRSPDELRVPRIPQIQTLLERPHRAPDVLCVFPLRKLLAEALPLWSDVQFTIGAIAPSWMDIPELDSSCEIRVRSTDVRGYLGNAGFLINHALLRSRHGFVTYRDGRFTARFQLHLCLYHRRRRTCSIPMCSFRLVDSRWSMDEWPCMPF